MVRQEPVLAPPPVGAASVRPIGAGGRYTLFVRRAFSILMASAGLAAVATAQPSGTTKPAAKPPQLPATSKPASPNGNPDPRAANLDAMSAATRLIDQLANEGLETAVLVGLPTPGERQRVAQIGREAIARLAQAEVELSSRATTMAAVDPDGAKRIRQFDLAIRLPLLRARAALLVGVAERDLARLSGAVDLLESVDPIAVGPAALRRVNLALALYHRAVLMGVMPGQESADMKRSVEMLRWIGEARVGDDPASNVPPVLLAEAWFAAVRVFSYKDASLSVAQRAGDAESRPPFVGGSSAADPGMLLRHAQVRAAAMASLWSGGGRVSGFPTVIAPIEAAAKPSKLGLNDDQCRAIRDELIGRAAGAVLEAGGNSSELPTAALVAWGGVLAREPGMRGRAIDLLDEACARPDIKVVGLAAEANMHAALALSQSSDAADRVFAVARLIEAIEQGLKEPRRGAILSVLPGLAQQGVLAAEAAPSRNPELIAKAGQLRLTALKLAGRGSAGGLALAESELRQHPEPDAAVLARALDALSAVASDAPEAARAAQLGAAAVEAALVRARKELAKFPTAESSGALARVAQLGIDWHTARKEPAGAARAKVALAEAMVAAGDKRAVDLYRELLSIEPPPDQPLRMTVGLARAQRASGDVVGAFATYRGMVELLEEEPTKRPEYFVAWADMLQVLASDNATGHRNGQIKLRITQLRSIDPELGSPEAKETIEMVETMIKG